MSEQPQTRFQEFDVGASVLSFGKYKGLTYSQVCEKDEGYLYCLTKKGWYDSPPEDKWFKRNEHVKAWIKDNIYKKIIYGDARGNLRGDARGEK